MARLQGEVERAEALRQYLVDFGIGEEGVLQPYLGARHLGDGTARKVNLRLYEARTLAIATAIRSTGPRQRGRDRNTPCGSART